MKHRTRFAIYLCVLLLPTSSAAELLLFEDFENNVNSPLAEDSNSAHYTPNTAATKYSTSVKQAGSYAAAYYALSGTNERTPLEISCDSSCVTTESGESDGIEEGYFEWYEYFGTGYPFATSGQTIFRIGYDHGSYPAEKKEIVFATLTSNSSLQIAYFCGVWGNSTNCNVDDSVSSGTGITTGTWVKFGLWVKLNSSGNSDGFIKLYKDDTMVLGQTNIDIRGSNTKGLNYWALGGSYSMTSGNLSSSGTRYFDSFSWHTSKPEPVVGDLLLFEDFENNVNSPLQEDANTAHYTPNTAATKYSTSVKQAGSYAAAYYALSGTNERTPLDVSCDSSCVSTESGESDGIEEGYFEWYEYYGSGYPFATSGQSIFRIGYDNGSFPAEKKEIVFANLGSNASLQVSYFCGQWGNSTNCNVDGSTSSGNGVATGTWIKFGLWIKLNSSGNSDGFIKLYQDDSLILNQANINLRGTNTKGLNYWAVGGSYSMSSGNLSSSGTRYFDSLSWYSTKPVPAPPEGDLLLFEDFENNLNDPLAEEFNSAHYTPNTSATKYSSTVKQAGSYAAAYYALSGTNERTPIEATCDSTCVSDISGEANGVEEAYFEWYEHFASGYPFASSGQKMFRIGYDHASFPAEKKEIGLAVLNSNASIQVAYFCGQWGNSSNCNVDHGVGTGSGIATGTWVKFGLWIKLNTPGDDDGFVKVYKDNTLILNEVDVDIRGTNTKGLNYWWIGGNYSMLSGNLSSSGTRYFDSLSWYSSKPAS